MKCKLALANKLICVKDLVNENGTAFTKEGDIWENTYYGYGTMNTILLVRMNKNGIPVRLTIHYDLLMEHFEEYK